MSSLETPQEVQAMPIEPPPPVAKTKKKRKPGIDRGHCGEYLAAGELLRRGFEVQVASRGTKGYDLLVAAQPGAPFRRIQSEGRVESAVVCRALALPRVLCATSGRSLYSAGSNRPPNSARARRERRVVALPTARQRMIAP
jgi:hypothetical protein